MNINNLVGLKNYGNTCFMNSGIQMLMNAVVLACFLMEHKEFMETDANKYIQTFKDYYHEETKNLGPKILYVKYMRLNTRYLGFTQEDAHEFLTYTLDDIMENIKSLKNEEWTSQLEKLMTVSLTQFVHYKKGQDKDSEKIVKENMLSFPMNDDVTTLEDCYKLFQVEDNEDFTLSLKFKTHPKYLFIGLKRFIVRGRGIHKFNSKIKVPLQTNMFDNHNYSLKSFIMHVGNHMGGHYYAYGYRKINDEYKWYCFNDNHVSEVSIDRVNSELENAYILLYTQK